MKIYIVVTDVVKVLIHVWSHDFYDITLSTGKQQRHIYDKSIIFSANLKKGYQRKHTQGLRYMLAEFPAFVILNAMVASLLKDSFCKSVNSYS